MTKKLLVTGASGFLGWNLCLAAQKRYTVHGTCNTHHYFIDGIDMHSIDLCDRNMLDKLFKEISPDIVIHTAAAADPNYCQNNPDVSQEINVTASASLAQRCADYGIPFVFTSTDLVFDGNNAPYHEDDPVSPVSLYGEQKAAAEQAILASCPGSVVCRMPLMYGDAPVHAKSFIHPMISAITDHRTLTLFTDEFRCPCSAKDAAEGLLLAPERGMHGILHLGGPQRLSRYDMGTLLGDALNIPPNLAAAKQSDVRMSAPRPPDVTLDSSKATTLGFAPKTMAERLSELAIIKKYRDF